MRPRCIVAANAVPRLGGQGANLYYAVAALREAFDLTLYARGPADGIPLHAVPDSRLARTVQAIRVVRRLRDWQVLASETHFDRYVAARLEPVALFHGAGSQCLRSLEVARTLGCRTLLDVVTPHADVYAELARPECARFGVRFPLHPRLLSRMRLEYERADAIRVMSDLARRSFVERGVAPERVFVLSPPVDLAEFPVAKFAHPVFRVSFVGHLEPWKGFRYLLEAFGRLPLRDAELVLWGGSGSRRVSQYLARSLAADRRISVRTVDVRLYGYGRVYGTSSVLVHPSLTDGYAFVVAEAMASGIPVIVTDQTGAAANVRDGENGYIVPAGDAPAILDRLEHLAGRPALVREMGAAARATMAKQTLAGFRAGYASVLQRLIG